ncbi:hypothetical protein BU17DRAFT_60105 [Hysterangium stoloniferum]|nr:hypothetical protein BU17DRAFT_60105 [Hysterangium stoloniferum]
MFPTVFVDLLRAEVSVESSSLAAIVVMVYDYALTIHYEKSVWQRQWSLGKFLYLFVRYLGLFIAIFDFFATFRSEGQANCVIIHLRVLVLNNKTLHSQGGSNVKPSCEDIIWWDIFSNFGCTLDTPGTTIPAQRFWIGMLPSLINETILCFLMMLKAIQNYRDEYRVPMLSGMIRDSIIYFASIFGALLVNSTIYYPRNEVRVQITIVPIGDYAFQMDKYYIVHDGIPPDFNRFERLSAHRSAGQITIDPTHE